MPHLFKAQITSIAKLQSPSPFSHTPDQKKIPKTHYDHNNHSNPPLPCVIADPRLIMPASSTTKITRSQNNRSNFQGQESSKEKPSRSASPIHRSSRWNLPSQVNWKLEKSTLKGTKIPKSSSPKDVYRKPLLFRFLNGVKVLCKDSARIDTIPVTSFTMPCLVSKHPSHNDYLDQEIARNVNGDLPNVTAGTNPSALVWTSKFETRMPTEIKLPNSHDSSTSRRAKVRKCAFGTTRNSRSSTAVLPGGIPIDSPTLSSLAPASRVVAQQALPHPADLISPVDGYKKKAPAVDSILTADQTINPLEKACVATRALYEQEIQRNFGAMSISGSSIGRIPEFNVVDQLVNPIKDSADIPFVRSIKLPHLVREMHDQEMDVVASKKLMIDQYLTPGQRNYSRSAESSICTSGKKRSPLPLGNRLVGFAIGLSIPLIDCQDKPPLAIFITQENYESQETIVGSRDTELQTGETQKEEQNSEELDSVVSSSPRHSVSFIQVSSESIVCYDRSDKPCSLMKKNISRKTYGRALENVRLASDAKIMLKASAALRNQTVASHFENRIVLGEQQWRLALSMANPAPIGLVCFGLTTVLLSLHNVGVFNALSSGIMAMGFTVGGITQIFAGILEYNKGNTLGMTAFISYGFFWISLLASSVFVQIGFAAKPDFITEGTFMLLWAYFTAVMFAGALKKSKVLSFVLGSLLITFLILTVEKYTKVLFLARVAGVFGLVCGLSALYLGYAEVINEAWEIKSLPV